MSNNIHNLLFSAGLTSSQYQNGSKAAQTLTNLHLAPIDVAAAASGVQNAGSAADAVGAGISAAKAGLALLEAVAKDVPIAGALLNLGSLTANLTKGSKVGSGLSLSDSQCQTANESRLIDT